MKRHAKSLQEKMKSHDVQGKPWGWVVTSASSGKEYHVRQTGADNFCCVSTDQENPCFNQYRPGKDCSHILSVRDYLEKASNRSFSLWETEEEARRQHRPISLLETGLLATSRLRGS